ncbi:hypothetical protein C0J52_27217 [Blattella germanica]|nr:hypothetical protein C0J52_27217 [Blattella germanica]
MDERLKIALPPTPEFTAFITGHGRTRSYLHRFRIIDDPTCTCGRGQQTDFVPSAVNNIPEKK